jgi:hypothetical protein
MSFHGLNRWFTSRANGYEAKVSVLQSQIGVLPDWQHRYLTESLISEIWLTWCLFSRTLIHKSIRGTKTRDWKKIPPRTGDNSWERIGYESKQASRSKPLSSVAPASFLMRHEPTWGDVGVILKIINALSPANKAQLSTAFGLPLTGPKHIQQVRNCTAHKTVENLLELRSSFSLFYSISAKATPAEIAWAYKIGSADIALYLWIYEMRIIVDHATASA